MYSYRQNEIRRFLYKDGIPLTLAILLTNVVTFFLVLGLPHFGLSQYLDFATTNWPRFFWTPLTWPLTSGHSSPLDLVFGAGWFYFFSGSLERSWGTRDYGVFLVSITAIMAVTVWAGSFLFGIGLLSGLWVISGPLTVAWTTINRRETMQMFFIPLPAPVIGLLGAALTWYHGGAMYGNPMIGLFALSGCAAAYWYVIKGRSGAFSSVRSPRSTTHRVAPPDLGRNRESVGGGFSPSRWLRDRRERKRLEDLFRRSGFRDDDKRR